MDRQHDHVVFRRKIDDALKTVTKILEQHRNPRVVEDVEHEHGDLYRLVDQMTNTALIGQLNVLSYLGLTADILQSIDKTKSTTLRFRGSQSCNFLKAQLVEIPEGKHVEEDEQTQTSGSRFFKTMTKSTIKQVINHVSEFHWKVEVKWEISLESGSQVYPLKHRSSNMILIIQSNGLSPLPKHPLNTSYDVPLNWLMRQLDTEKLASTFSVARHVPTTMTPCHNTEVESALDQMKIIQEWSTGVVGFFKHGIQRDIVRKHSPAGPTPYQYPDLASCAGENIFVPVQPIMEVADVTRDTKPTTESKSLVSWAAASVDDMDTVDARSPLLSFNDVHTLLNEQIRSIDEQVATLAKTYPCATTSQALLTVLDATVVHVCIHSEALGRRYNDCVNFVESMLEKQLCAAIGKRIQSSDIDKFLRYHNAKLLNPVPKTFCHPIRQPGHYPCGLLSIESLDVDGDKTPIQTLVKEVKSSTLTKMPLNAATTIELTGQRFLHGWIRHRFEANCCKFELIARARQFSAFLLVVGTMVGHDILDPKEAIIVQNKDEYLIPLLLEEIPTTKEFKKAIRSLSPEQQRFTEAFRTMQLDSSVMGICVIQIKPQLEKLLGLPQDALMKEMKLTEDLSKLFINYQVPPDLLSYDGIDSNPSSREMVDNVRGHVKAILGVIQEQKKECLEEEERREKLSLTLWKTEQPLYDWMGAGREPIYDRPRDAAKPGCDWQLKPEKSLGETEEPLYDWSGARPVCDPRDEAEPEFDWQVEKGFQADRFVCGAYEVDNDYCWDYGKPDSNEWKKVVQTDMMDSHPRGKCENELSFSESSSNPPIPTRLVSQTGMAKTSRASNTTHPTPSAITDKDLDDKETVMKDQKTLVRDTNDSIVNDDTMLPRILNSKIEELASGVALRSTTLKLDKPWQVRQEDILGKPTSSVLQADDEIIRARNQAFDLLDALSRSGSLAIEFSELHVIVAMTHSFEKDVINTIIQDNINPIEKLELSTLLLGSVIHGVPADQLLVRESDVHRLKLLFPALFAYTEVEE